VEMICLLVRIAGRHAELREEEGGTYSLEPLEKNARLLLNGKAVVERTPLKHNDRSVPDTLSVPSVGSVGWCQMVSVPDNRSVSQCQSVRAKQPVEWPVMHNLYQSVSQQKGG